MLFVVIHKTFLSMAGVGIAIVSGGGSLRESSPRLHASRHAPQFLRDPAHPQIPTRGLSYRIEVVRHGYKISDQIVMTDGRKVLAATSSVLWKLDYVIRAIRHVCFSKQSGIVALCHPSNDTGVFTDVKKIWSEISRFGKRRIHAGW